MEYTATDALQKEVYVSSWGYASSGQIGNVKYENFTINPNMIEVGDSEISKVAAGESHTIFTDSKTVYGCGSKKFGQLGVGEEEKLLKVYHKAKGLDGLEIDQVFAGGEHSFAITTKGEVYSWGLNFKGQLGSGSFDNRYIPELVDNFWPRKDKSHTNSKANDFLMKRSKSREQMKGKMKGSNIRPSKSTTPEDRGGDYNDLKPSKSVDLTNRKSNDGTDVHSPGWESLLFPKEKIISIAWGAIHTMALSSIGRIFSWGNGASYSLGHGNRETLTLFKPISYFYDNNIKASKIAWGINHSGCISDKGKVYLWGITSDISYSPEMKEKCLLKSPTSISFLPGAGGSARVKSKEPIITDLKWGECFSIALSSTGKVYTWGTNELGQLGNGDDQPIAEPTHVELLNESISKIGCGMKHWVVISSNFQIYAWGSNVKGQLGIKTDNICSPTPVHVPIYENANPFRVICGYYHNVVLSYKAPNLTSLEDEFSLLGENKNLNKEEEVIKLKQEVVRLRKQLLLRSGQILLNSNLNDSEIDSSGYDIMIDKNPMNKRKDSGISMMETERQFHANFEVRFKDLKFDSKLSEGGYGIVHKGRWKCTTVAIKEIKKEIIEQDKLEEFRNECSVMEVIRHPNIVMFLGACTKPPNLCIVLEYCTKGSLWSWLHDPKIKIAWEFRRKIALDIAKGVLYLHSQNPPILHRDLKSLNILLDNACTAKLADFGWTRIKAKVMTSKIGTYQWMAPEVIAGFKYTEKADVFSFGVILWELATRKPPYYGIDGTEVSKKVMREDMRPKISEKDCPRQFLELMNSCWDRTPEKRPFFDEIIEKLEAMKLPK